MSSPEEQPKIEETKVEDRAQLFFKELNEKSDLEKCPLVISLVLDPQSKDPLIYTKGSVYNIAKMLSKLSRHYKELVIEEIDK